MREENKWIESLDWVTLTDLEEDVSSDFRVIATAAEETDKGEKVYLLMGYALTPSEFDDDTEEGLFDEPEDESAEDVFVMALCEGKEEAQFKAVDMDLGTEFYLVSDLPDEEFDHALELLNQNEDYEITLEEE